MDSKQRLFIVAMVGLVLFAAGYVMVRGQEQAPAPPAQPAAAQQPAPTTPKPGTIALPSPLRWSDAPDTRPAELILQAEREKSGLEFLRAYHPLRAQEIEKNKAQNPHEYFQSLNEAFNERTDMEHQRGEDPQGFAGREQALRFEARSEQLALEYRTAAPDKQPVLELQLRELLNQVFEMRQAQVEERLKEAEREYLHLKNIAEKRRKNKDRVVEQRIFQLLGEEEIFQMW